MKRTSRPKSVSPAERGSGPSPLVNPKEAGGKPLHRNDIEQTIKTLKKLASEAMEILNPGGGEWAKAHIQELEPAPSDDKTRACAWIALRRIAPIQEALPPEGSERDAYMKTMFEILDTLDKVGHLTDGYDLQSPNRSSLDDFAGRVFSQAWGILNRQEKEFGDIEDLWFLFSKAESALETGQTEQPTEGEKALDADEAPKKKSLGYNMVRDLLDNVAKAGRPLNVMEIMECTKWDRGKIYKVNSMAKKDGYLRLTGKATYDLTEEGRAALKPSP